MVSWWQHTTVCPYMPKRRWFLSMRFDQLAIYSQSSASGHMAQGITITLKFQSITFALC